MKRDRDWMDRFRREIGKLIFNAPTVALTMGHASPVDTLRDYFDVGNVEDTPEEIARLFVKEFSVLCSPFVRDRRDVLKQFAQRWTGLDDPAADLRERLSADLDEQVEKIRKAGG